MKLKSDRRRRHDSRAAIRSLIRAIHGLTLAVQSQTKAIERLGKKPSANDPQPALGSLDCFKDDLERYFRELGGN